MPLPFSIIAQNAPNLVLTDMDGQTHDVYSYLEDGKTVILDFFTTWCIPCKDAAPHMEELWSTYGPEGGNSLIVLSIEVAEIPDNNLTAVTNVWPIVNPVINLNGIPDAYESFVMGYPTYVVVCGDQSTTTSVGFGYPYSVVNWHSMVNTCTKEGVIKDALLLEPIITRCDNSINVIMDIGNAGNVPIYDFTIDTYVDSNLVDSYIWNGGTIMPVNNPANFMNTSVEFNIDEADGDAVDFVIFTEDDMNSLNDSYQRTFDEDVVSVESEITITINTDDYPYETSWNLVNTMGTIVAQGGGSTESITLSLQDHTCYTFTIEDSFGDGICCDWGAGSFTIENQETVLIEGGQFGYIDRYSFYTMTEFAIDELNGNSQLLYSEYYNIKGQQIKRPLELGLTIRKDVYENGLVKYEKIIQ